MGTQPSNSQLPQDLEVGQLALEVGQLDLEVGHLALAPIPPASGEIRLVSAPVLLDLEQTLADLEEAHIHLHLVEDLRLPLRLLAPQILPYLGAPPLETSEENIETFLLYIEITSISPLCANFGVERIIF